MSDILQQEQLDRINSPLSREELHRKWLNDFQKAGLKPVSGISPAKVGEVLINELERLFFHWIGREEEFSDKDIASLQAFHDAGLDLDTMYEMYCQTEDYENNLILEEQQKAYTGLTEEEKQQKMRAELKDEGIDVDKMYQKFQQIMEAHRSEMEALEEEELVKSERMRITDLLKGKKPPSGSPIIHIVHPNGPKTWN